VVEGVLEHIACILLSELLLHLPCIYFWQDNWSLKLHALNRSYFVSPLLFVLAWIHRCVLYIHSHLIGWNLSCSSLTNCASKLTEFSGVSFFKNCKICCIYMISSPIFYVGLTVKVIRLKWYTDMQDNTVQK